jgi:hypothetical protein
VTIATLPSSLPMRFPPGPEWVQWVVSTGDMIPSRGLADATLDRVSCAA